MPILDVAISQAREPQIVPEGRYRLECTAATSKLTRKGDRNMVQVTAIITNPPKSVTHPRPLMSFFVLPNAEDLKTNANMSNDWIVRLKRCMAAFGIRPKGNSINTDEFIGKRCEVPVSVGKDQNNEEVNEAMWPKFE